MVGIIYTKLERQNKTWKRGTDCNSQLFHVPHVVRHGMLYRTKLVVYTKIRLTALVFFWKTCARLASFFNKKSYTKAAMPFSSTVAIVNNR